MFLRILLSALDLPFLAFTIGSAFLTTSSAFCKAGVTAVALPSKAASSASYLALILSTPVNFKNSLLLPCK